MFAATGAPSCTCAVRAELKPGLSEMLRSAPCVLDVPGAFCDGGAHAVCLRTLGGRQQYLAVLPSNYLADVHDLIRWAFRMPKFKVKLVNLTTHEVSSEGRHQPFANLDTYFNVVFEWVSRCEPGEYLAVADGSAGGAWPTVSSDSAVAGAYQTPYTPTAWGPLALNLTEAMTACRVAGADWAASALELEKASEATLSRAQVKSIVKLVQMGEARGTAVGPLRLLLRHYNLAQVKRRVTGKTSPPRTSTAKALATLRR